MKHLNGAVEEKVGDPGVIFIFIFVDLRIARPKSWKELQVGIKCLTQLLAFLEAMASMNREAGAGEDSKSSTRSLLYFSNDPSTMARFLMLHLMACTVV